MSATAAEKLLGRELRRERRHGVWHYVTGQHAARLDWEMSEDGLPVYELSYIDVTGHAVLAYVALVGRHEATGWVPLGLVRAGQTFVSGVRQPDGFALSERMVEVLDAAAAEWARG